MMENLYINAGGAIPSQIITHFNHYTDVSNVGTGETDLYSDIIAGNTLGFNGDKLQLSYSGITPNNVHNGTLKVYFGGTLISTLTSNISNFIGWEISGLIIRVSSSVVRCSIRTTLNTGSVSSMIYTEVTGLDLTGDNILKITGQSDSASNDITAKLGTVAWVSH